MTVLECQGTKNITFTPLHRLHHSIHQRVICHLSSVTNIKINSMVAINVVKENNASLKDYGPGLVGVFGTTHPPTYLNHHKLTKQSAEQAESASPQHGLSCATPSLRACTCSAATKPRRRKSSRSWGSSTRKVKWISSSAMSLS